MSQRVIAIVDDMFFASKIRATAEALGVEIVFPRTQEIAIEKLRDNKPRLVICDLQNRRIDPVEFAKRLKSDPELESIPLLGFFSHVEVELQKRAVEAGFDNVIPRSLFARDLGAILKGN
jgi:two-component system, cell cycle response regulator DivK